MRPTTVYVTIFSCSEVEKIKNNQFYHKIHIPTENVYFLHIIKGLPQPARTFFSSKLNEKYELTSNKLLQLLVKVCTSFL